MKPPSTTQATITGRCDNCEIKLRWPQGTMLLRDAYCPFCGEKLLYTTHACKYSECDITSPATPEIAQKLQLLKISPTPKT